MKNDAKFEDIFQEQLDDLFDAENQIVGALPKLIAECLRNRSPARFRCTWMKRRSR